MPSWPARLHLGSSAPGSGPKSRASKSPPFREDRNEDNGYHNQPLHGVPVIALTGASGTSRPSHGRSYSHPFPSIFGSGRKADKMSEYDYNDNSLGVLTESPFVSTPMDHMTANETSLENEEKDLVTGRCFTCNSLVRWPRRLDVFRCTVCLTVNDLKPGPRLSIEGSEAEGPCATTPFTNLGLPRKGTTDSTLTK